MFLTRVECVLSHKSNAKANIKLTDLLNFLNKWSFYLRNRSHPDVDQPFKSCYFTHRLDWS